MGLVSRRDSGMERILIFGAGEGGRRGYHALPRGQRAVAFIDNDAAKHGTRLLGLPVIAPANITSTPHDRILVASKYQKEILAQLRELGIPLKRVDLIDPDVLTGLEDPPVTAWWWLAAAVVIVLLAGYGVFCLVSD